jgi:hypothetical protein
LASINYFLRQYRTWWKWFGISPTTNANIDGVTLVSDMIFISMRLKRKFRMWCEHFIGGHSKTTVCPNILFPWTSVSRGEHTFSVETWKPL